MTAPCWAVMVAGGRGRRFGGDTPKQYYPLCGRTVLAWSCDAFIQHPAIGGVVVVLPEGDAQGHGILRGLSTTKPLLIATGGAERADSVCAGLRRVMEHSTHECWALVHDAARPCLSLTALDLLIQTLRADAVGGLLAIPARDTLKQAGTAANPVVQTTIDRRMIWQAQTPQMFRAGALLRAIETAQQAGMIPTDESAAMEYLGLQPRLVEGEPENLKITTPNDLRLATFLLQERMA